MGRLRFRGGEGEYVPPSEPPPPPPPPEEDYGCNEAAVRAATVPQAVINDWGGNCTVLSPSNSQTVNQSLVNNDTTGHIWVPKGTYYWHDFRSKADTEFRFESPPAVDWASYSRTASNCAVINGGGNAGRTFRNINPAGEYQDNVIVKGGYWTNNGQPSPDSLGRQYTYMSAIDAGNDWTVQDVEAAYNYQAGVGSRTQVEPEDPTSSGINVSGGTLRRVYMHHNGRYGTHGNFQLVENCRLSYNNTGKGWPYGPNPGGDLNPYDPGWDAGGTKVGWEPHHPTFHYAERCTWRYNWFHNNYGWGLWFDYDDWNLDIYDNLFENNDGGGMRLEVNVGGMRVHHNSFLDNGYWSTCGGLGWPKNDLTVAALGMTECEATRSYDRHGHSIAGSVNFPYNEYYQNKFDGTKQKALYMQGGDPSCSAMADRYWHIGNHVFNNLVYHRYTGYGAGDLYHRQWGILSPAGGTCDTGTTFFFWTDGIYDSAKDNWFAANIHHVPAGDTANRFSLAAIGSYGSWVNPWSEYNARYDGDGGWGPNVRIDDL